MNLPSPSITSIDRTIAVSNGCTSMVGDRQTTIPEALDNLINRDQSGQDDHCNDHGRHDPGDVTRCGAGIGAFMIAVDGL